MIRFVYDLGYRRREQCRPALDALADPILAHLPGALKADESGAGDLNVHFYHDYPSDVFIGHGISDKGYLNTDTLAEFGFVFCSGPAWTRKHLARGIPERKLREVGYPKLDPIFNGAITPKAATVLWAPSLSRGWQAEFLALEALLVDVEHSLHPVDAPGNATLQKLADADVVIGDVGSTVYEAWSLGKPVVFPDYAVRNVIAPGSLEEVIYREGIGYHADSPKQLMGQIELARIHGITDREVEFVEGIFPASPRGVSGLRHAEALQEMAA